MHRNDELIGEMVGSLDHFAGALARFREGQGEDADEGNADRLSDAAKSLAELREAVEYLVP